MTTAIIAALPRELRLLTRGWTRLDVTARGVLAFRRNDALAVCAGMGRERAAVAVEAALRLGTVDRLLSFGLAGSCDPAVAAGSVQACAAVIDVRSGERFDAQPVGEGERCTATLVSTPIVAGVREKRRLHDTYHATLVDMEAATVGRLARAHTLLFSACKGISDDAGTEIAGIDRFAGAHGEFREAAFALHVALRPGLWSAAAALGRNSSHALRGLAELVLRDLNHSDPRQHDLPA